MKSQTKLSRTLRAATGPVLFAAAPDGGGPPKFEVNAYTGVPIMVEGWDVPVIVDLAGMALGKNIVANLDHDPKQLVGHVTDTDNDGKQLQLSGVASARTQAREQVVGSAQDGFTWQASIEAKVHTEEKLAAGSAATINGREWQGPLVIARKTTLKGFAFTAHGADDNTSTSIAASAASHTEIRTMTEFDTWLAANEFDVAALPDKGKAFLQAQFDREKKEKADAELRAAEAKALAARGAQTVDEIVAAEKAKQERVNQLNAKVAEFVTRYPHAVEAIGAMGKMALEQNWTVDQLELNLFKASQPQLSHFHVKKPTHLSDKVLEAAVCKAGRLTNLEDHFDAQTLELADQKFRYGLGLEELLLMGARDGGCNAVRASSDLEGVLRACFPRKELKAQAFSTLNIPNILSNTANKFLREGWMTVDQTWKNVSTQTATNDLKQYTTISLTGGTRFEKVGPTGQLKHGTLGELTYTNQAETYGQMLAITRTHILNDDLGALTSAPRRLGRNGALALVYQFWTIFLNNSSFFTSGNSNVSTGAGSALGDAGLAAAEVKFMNQTDPDGNPVGFMPAILLVPPTLKSTAMKLNSSQLFIGGTTNTSTPGSNIWAGRFRVESSPYMENSNLTGNSTAAWYLLTEPNVSAVIDVGLLGGRDTPTVETTDADFNVLGIQMRGFFDFGVALQEYRAGVRSAGS